VKKIIFLLLVTLSFCITTIYAQRPGGRLGNLGNGGFGGQTGNPQGNRNGQDNASTNPTDGTKPKKGKILDDSTKQIYGPKTVYFFTEEDLLNNRAVQYRIDTLKDNFHKISFLQRNDRVIQDLGNWGTATRNLFFTPNHTVGASLGYHAFDYYTKDPSKLQYYNTKSPFTNMEFLAGGRGENLVSFVFNRNVNARWNVGTQLQSFNSKKQYSSRNGASSQAVRNWNAVFHSSYFSKDSSYTLLANASYTTHKNIDEGGVKITPNNGGIVASEDPYLSGASSNEKRRFLHVYQQLKQSNGLQFYHIFDLKNQTYSFEDQDLTQGINEKIYQLASNIDTIFANKTGEEFLFRRYMLAQNILGVKGFKNGFNYRIHLRRKDFSVRDSLNNELVPYTKNKDAETIAGLWLNYYFKDSTRAFVQTEYLLGGDYSIQAIWQRKRINFGFSQSSIRPNLMQKAFYSTVGEWNTNFKNTFTNSFSAELPLRYKGHELSVSGQYHVINNFTYFNDQYQPTQHTKLLSFLQLGIKENYKANKWIIANQVLFSKSTGSQILSFPSLFVNSRVSYTFIYKKVLPLIGGLDLHYRSAYYAMDYQAAIQQFYVQQAIKTKNILLADAFVSTNLNRVRLTVKYSHLNQLVFGNYFVGPKHKGLKGGIGFGVSWPLFD
jgi:hypothetical protein